MLRAVIDTNILIAAQRSRGGASHALLLDIMAERVKMLVSVPLFLEYEAVQSRPEHLLEFGLTVQDIHDAMADMAAILEPVELHYLWRPQLADPADEMVLETAINGQADCVVTHNLRDFQPAAGRFGIDVILPAEALRRIRQ